MREEELRRLVKANFHGWKRGGSASELMRRNFEFMSDKLETEYSLRVIYPEEKKTYFDHRFMEAVGSIVLVPEILERHEIAGVYSPFPGTETREERTEVVYEVAEVGFWDLENKRLVEPAKVIVASGERSRMGMFFTGKGGVVYEERFFRSVRDFTDWVGMRDPFTNETQELLKEVWRKRNMYSWVLPVSWVEDFETLFKVWALGCFKIRAVLEGRLKGSSVEPHLFLDAWVRRAISDIVDLLLKSPKSWEELMSLTELLFKSETANKGGVYYTREMFPLYLSLYVGFFSVFDYSKEDLEIMGYDVKDILRKLKRPEVAEAEAEVLRKENERLKREVAKLEEDLERTRQVKLTVVKEYEKLERELKSLRKKSLLLKFITGFAFLLALAEALLLLLYLLGPPS